MANIRSRILYSIHLDLLSVFVFSCSIILEYRQLNICSLTTNVFLTCTLSCNLIGQEVKKVQNVRWILVDYCLKGWKSEENALLIITVLQTQY